MPATKRKVTTVAKDDDAPERAPLADTANQQEETSVPADDAAPPKKKAKKDDKPKYKSLWDVVLDGEEEDEIRVFDDCNDIRRKIRALQKEPGHKVTHWLKAIGNVNSNSYNRFMKLTGPYGGSDNSTYYSAYIYFEKKRIFEGKKKSAKRLNNEMAYDG